MIGRSTGQRIESKCRKVYLAAGLAMTLSEAIKQLVLTFAVGGGQYNWWYFPFQLCSITMYLCLIAGFTKNDRVFDACTAFISSFGLLGGVMAFFDTTGFYYPVTVLTVHSFAWHVLLIFLGLYAAFTGRKVSFLKPAGIYLVCCVIAEVINISVYQLGSVNMFYISPKYQMQQRGFSLLIPYLGNYGAIAVYILLTMAGAWIIDRLARGVCRLVYGKL